MKYRVEFRKTIVDPQERAIRLSQAFARFEPTGKSPVDKMPPQIRLMSLEFIQKYLRVLTPEEEAELTQIKTTLSEAASQTRVEKEVDSANGKSTRTNNEFEYGWSRGEIE